MSATPQQAPATQKLILIVDDTPLNIGVISGALKDFYKTKVATNGEKALALAGAEEKPDLILLDVMMPGMSGFDVCNILRDFPETRATPIIFLTAVAEMPRKIMGLRLGANDYITKPFDLRELTARVEVALRNTVGSTQ